LRKRKEKRTK
jgi:hypothetical protein